MVGAKSAWDWTHGEDFQAPLIPFGSLVYFIPNKAQGFSSHKLDPRGVPGVFAGYGIKDGYRWDKHFHIWPLCDFGDADLSLDAPPSSFRRLTCHMVKEVSVPQSPVEFPLKSRYEHVNHTLSGIRERAAHLDLPYAPLRVIDPLPLFSAPDQEDYWITAGPGMGARAPCVPRSFLFHPSEVSGGPDVTSLIDSRYTLKCVTDGAIHNQNERWKEPSPEGWGCSSTLPMWTGTTTFVLRTAGLPTTVGDAPPAPEPALAEERPREDVPSAP